MLVQQFFLFLCVVDDVVVLLISKQLSDQGVRGHKKKGGGALGRSENP